ncbi:MAG: SurA N-terminal domain-containing protein, partial [Gammaproteobacteria bacterium]|nr:SurA N-terminal domain-containing protein [Gammaproteobacteria bacterium]
MRLTPLFLLLFALFSPLHAAVQELNGIAAVVDDDVITWNELNKRVESISAQLRQRGNLQLPPREILERQILERLIIEKLQLNHAREVGLKVNDEQLNTIIGNIATENGLSLEAFRAALEA